MEEQTNSAKTESQDAEVKTDAQKPEEKSAEKKPEQTNSAKTENAKTGLSNFYVEGYGNCRGKNQADAEKRAAKLKTERRK